MPERLVIGTTRRSRETAMPSGAIAVEIICADPSKCVT